MLTASLVFCLSIGIVSAASVRPNLVHPLQAQRPPVARVNQTWSWQLLPGTFSTPADASILLSCLGLPTWATFDAESWALQGVPFATDVGSTYVTIQANASGNPLGTSDKFNLLVVDDVTSPMVGLTVASQLADVAQESGGASTTPDGSLLVPPTWSFALGFQQYTIKDVDNSQIFYTAYEKGTTALPAWLEFDNATVTFTGLAPSTPGQYAITIFGSNFFGYGDVQQTFKLTVNAHSFELLEGLAALNTTPADSVNYTISIDDLRIDNSSVLRSNVSTIDVDLTSVSYLAFDPSSRTLSGVVPATSAPGNLSIPVTFVDSYNDSLTTNLSMIVYSSLFTDTSLGQLNVVAGQAFTEDVSQFITSREAVYSAQYSPSGAASWLSFDPDTLVLSGSPPLDLMHTVHDATSEQNISIDFVAGVAATGISGQATMTLNVRSPGTTAATGSSQSQSTHASVQRKLAIELSLGIVGSLILLAIVMATCRRFCSADGRRRKRSESMLNYSGSTLAGTAAQEHSTAKAPTEKIEGTDAYTGEYNAAKPKRFGLMSFFKTSASKSQKLAGPLPVSQNSLFQLGHRDDSVRSRNIIVVTEDASCTFSPQSDDTLERSTLDGESDVQRSSWGSQGSSSLFYSDASESGQTRRPVQESPSVPRRRKDFMAVPPRSRRQASSSSDTSSAYSLNAPDGIGLRLVSRGSTPNLPEADMSLAQADTLESLEQSEDGTRLVAFANRRTTPELQEPDQKRYSSQTAVRQV